MVQRINNLEGIFIEEREFLLYKEKWVIKFLLVA